MATVRRGDFFGEVAFFDRGRRSADAVAEADTDLFVLSRARVDALAEQHPRLGRHLFADLGRVLSLRLRMADREIHALGKA